MSTSSEDSSHRPDRRQPAPSGSAPRAAGPVVTLLGLYGSGVSVIGPRVADRLGVPYLDRDIIAAVARQMHLPEAAVEDYDSETPKEPRRGFHRYLDSLGHSTTDDAAPMADPELQNRFRIETERFLARATTGGGVVVGRAGVMVLRSMPGALHVRLDGPRDARIEQAMRIDGVDRPTAQRRRRADDRARLGYVRRTYAVDPNDPNLYHLWINSTALEPDTCVELIVAATRTHAAHPATR